jgi:hypothetical protein
MERVPFPSMGVYFLSREPVRAGPPLADFAKVSRGLEAALPGVSVAGSLSASHQDRFVVARCPQRLGTAGEAALTEVYDYDPVRYQANVIGLVEPPADTPVHWICRRVNPTARVVAVVDAVPQQLEGMAAIAAPRGYLGNSDTLLAVGRILKGKGAVLIESVGAVFCAPSAESLVSAIQTAGSEGTDPVS